MVRLNKSLPLPQSRFKDIGCRTDILYNSLNTSDFPGENNISEKFFIKNKIQFLCMPYPNKKPFKNDIKTYLDGCKGVIPFKIMADNTFNNIQTIIGTRPNTGLAAIIDLLKTDLKHLYITGINFYKTLYYKEYRTVTGSDMPIIFNQHHNQEPQINLLRYLSLIDDRIILDRDLNIILYKSYRRFFKLKKEIERVPGESFITTGNNIFINNNNPHLKVIYVGSGKEVIDVSGYNLIICFNMKNIKNYSNIPIICFEYNNIHENVNIIGIVDINNHLTNTQTIERYTISKKYYKQIYKALNILEFDTGVSLDMFIVLALERYYDNLYAVNMNIVPKSTNYLLYKYMKQKNILKS